MRWPRLESSDTRAVEFQQDLTHVFVALAHKIRRGELSAKIFSGLEWITARWKMGQIPLKLNSQLFASLEYAPLAAQRQAAAGSRIIAINGV